MADFIISTVTTAPVNMTSSADSAFITEAGAILTSSASAVTIQNAGNLTVLGAIGHNTGNNLVFLNAATFPTILIGATGSVTNTANAAIGGTVADELRLTNHGIVHGETAAVIVAASDGSAEINLVNTGTMTGSSGIYSNTGSGRANIVNSGTIWGEGAGIIINSGALNLWNSGEIAISGPESWVRAIDAFSASSVAVVNTGTIFGNILLSAGADTFRSTLGTLSGTISAASGNDLVVTGATDDTVLGQGGDDVIKTGDGDDNLNGGTENDRLVAGDGDDTLVGEGGDDKLVGGAGADNIDGGLDYDHLTYVHSAAGVEIDLIFGRASGGDAEGDTIIGVEAITGSAFKDVLLGSDADDDLIGGRGNDTLNGRAGHDDLRGDSGNDVLRGGAGSDTFIFGIGSNADTIRDFTDDVDTLFLNDFGFASVAEALAFATVSGANVVFNFGDGDKVTLLGAAAFFADLGDDLFV